MDLLSLLSVELGDARRASCHMPEAIARKLALDSVLHGHDGCVNRLAWNHDGSMLASASDDCKVMLWHYPDTGRVPLSLHTEHRANLFGVNFLPQHNNTRIVSGAMDYTVQLHELEAGAFNILPKYRSKSSNAAASSMRRHPPQQQVHRVVPRTTVYQCHKSRVKEVEVCASEPTMFWSAGEDGAVRQFDTRVADQKAYGSPNVLVNLTSAGPRQQLVECKGLDINHMQPHLMAVACGDPYVRVFDRRRLSARRPGGPPSQPLLQLTSPHLPLLLKAGVNRRAHSTHVSFSHSGDRLVTSFHGDHAYIFDVTGAADGMPVALRRQQQQHKDVLASQSPRFQISNRRSDDLGLGITNGRSPDLTAAISDQPSSSNAALPANLPDVAEGHKVAGNNALFSQQYPAAVVEFTAAIAAAPWVAGLYTQRALAYLKRSWEGDAAYALRDCEMALDLVAEGQGAAAAAAAEQQARLRQVHALKQLGQYKCALAALDSYTHHYPKSSDNAEISSLREVLRRQLESQQMYKTKLRQQQHLLRQRQQQRSAAAAEARDQYRIRRQRQQQHHEDPETAAERELHQQQQEGAMHVSSAAVANADLTAAGSSDGGNRGSSSRDVSPIGAPTAEPPPGLGMRVDTDIDSEDLEDAQSPTAAAVATDTAATAAAAEPFIGPALRTPQIATAAAAGESGSSAQQQQHALAEASTAAAAAAAAVARGRATSRRIGLAAADAADSQGEARSDAGDIGSEDDHEDDHELSTSHREDAESDDELLIPWYGPSAYAQEQVRSAAAAAAGSSEQQQQQQPTSRRRPRSGSGTAEYDSGDDCIAAAAAHRSPQRPRCSSSQGTHHNGCHTNGYKTCYNMNIRYNNHDQQQCSWWDSLSGGGGRLLQRCIGHCNVQTDIKESVFLGQDDDLVACGSDDGCVFIYRADTGAVVRVLNADEDVANCVRCHPTLPVLATSGIDSVVRLWSPTAAADSSSCATHVNDNQTRMRDGPRLLRGAGIPTAALQAALDENPQLLQLLVQQLYGMGSGTAAAAARAPAGAEVGLGNPGEGLGNAGDGSGDPGGEGLRDSGERGLHNPGDEGGDGELSGQGGGSGHDEISCRVS